MPPNEYDALFSPPATSRSRGRTNYDDIIVRHSQRTGLDPELVRAIVIQESGGNPRAVSPKGAQGVGQLMPATARRFGVADPFDPEQNIRGATDYLKFLSDRFKGDRDLVLAGYNAGEGAVEKFGGIPPYRETRNYVQSINRRLGQQSQSADPYAALFDSNQPSGQTPSPPPVQQRRLQTRPAATAPSVPTSYWDRIRQRMAPQQQITSIGELRQAESTRRLGSIGELRQLDEFRAQARREQDKQTRAEVEREYRGRRGAYGAPTPTGMLHVIANPVDSLTGLFRSDKENINRETADRIRQQQIASEQEVEDIRREYGEMTPAQRSVAAPLIGRGGGGLLKVAGGLSSAFGLAPNRLSEWANRRGEIIETASSLPPLAEEQNLSSLITGEGQLKEVERGISEKIATGVADLGVSLGELILLRRATKLPFNQLLALEAAARNSDKPLSEQASRTAEAFALGTALDRRLSRPVSAAISGVPAAAQTGYEVSQGRMSPLDAAITTGIQTAQGAILTNPRRREPERIVEVEGRSTIPGFEAEMATRAQREAQVRPPLTPREVEQLQSSRPARPAEPEPVPQPTAQPVSRPRVEDAITSRAARQDRLTQLEGELTQWQRAGGRGQRGNRRIRQIEREMDDIRQSLQTEDAAAATRLTQERSAAVESTRYSSTPRFDEWVENRTGQRMAQVPETELSTLRERYRQEFADAPPPPVERELPPLDAPLQRFYHRDFGNVVEFPDQKGISKKKIRVQSDDGSTHVIKRTTLTGRGNERAVPIRPEPPAQPVESPVKAATPEVVPAATETASPPERYYAGATKGKPQGKYIYLTPDPLYAKNYGEVHEYKLAAKRPLDLTDLGEREFTAGGLRRVLKQRGVDVADFKSESTVRAKALIREPAWRWIRRYSEIAEQVKEAGYDSILHRESFGFGDNRSTATAVQVLDSRLVSPASVSSIERRAPERMRDSDWLELTPDEQARMRNELEASQRFPVEPKPAQTDILGEPPIRPPIPTTAEVPLPVREPVPEPTTAAKRASMSADRAELDLPELPAAERRSWQETLDQAKQRGTANASTLAEQVLNKPRSLSDVETGQLVLRAQEIKNQLSELRKEIVNDPTPERIAQSDALQEEFNRLTQATKTSGTEKGRTLAAQKLTINRDYDLTSLIQRATEAKGRKLTPEETTRYEQMAQRITELESQLSTVSVKATTDTIQREIDRASRQRKRAETKQQLDEEFAQLKTQFQQARAEARQVQASGLAGLDPEGKITPLIAKMAKNRIRAGINSAEALVTEVYETVKAQGWSKDDVAHVVRATINQSDDVLSRWDKRRQSQLIKQQEELNRRLTQRDFSKPAPRQPPIYNRETQRLQEQVQSLKNKFELELEREQPGHWWRQLSALRKSWMLSGVTTQVKNIGGTGGYQVFEEISRLPAAIADAAIAPLTGRRTLTTSPVQMLDAVLHARKVGLTEAGQILRRGATPEMLERHQFSEIDTGVKVIDFASNLVFRFMSASDRVFYQYSYKRSLNDRAMAQAKNEGAGRQRAKELSENPPEELDAAAKHDALVGTFNNNNRLSDAIKSARSRLGPKANFAIDVVMPFDRTPTNVIARVLEASPVGLGQSVYRLAKAIVNKSMTPAEQRQFSQTLGRATVGTALIGLGWKLADDVLDVEENGQVFVNVNGQRYNLNSISPTGNLLATGAKLRHDYEKGDALGAAKTVARTPLDQPLLRAGSEVTELLRDPERSATRTAARTASSFIPFGGAARDVARTLDPEERRFPDPKSFTQQVQQGIPVLRERLPVSRSKVFSGQPTSSPATKEIQRLKMRLQGAMPGDDEQPQVFERRRAAMNPTVVKELERLVESAAYQRLNDEEKKKQIRSLVQSVAAGFRPAGNTARRPARPSRRDLRP